LERDQQRARGRGESSPWTRKNAAFRLDIGPTARVGMRMLFVRGVLCNWMVSTGVVRR